MIKRQDGSVSRTKILNAIGVILGAVIMYLPTLKAQIPPEYYGGALFAFSVINQILRDTQRKL